MAVPSINLKMIRLGKTKKQTTPIIYDEYPFEMVVYGYAQFFAFPNALSIGLDIDKNNEDFFQSIEEKISSIFGKKLKLIKKTKFAKRVYAKPEVQNGKVKTPVGIFFDDPKIIKDPFEMVSIPFYARIVMRISRINAKYLSLICEANEIIVQ